MLRTKVLVAGSALTLSGILGACSTDVAGGVSEETNTVAGILMDTKGDAVAGATVLARHTVEDSLSYTDTTDEKGRFAFPIHRQGVYGISVDQDSLASYRTVEYLGARLEVEVSLEKTVSFEGRIALDSSMQLGGVEVCLPGTPWKVETDSTGAFRFRSVPEGSYAFVVNSPDPIRYLNGTYRVELEGDSAVLSGPMPAGSLVSGGVGEVSAKVILDNEIQLPLSTEYGLVSWWPMDYLTVSGKQRSIRDARGKSDGVLLYGESDLVEGVSGKALSLKGADQFGVVENDNGALAGSDQFTLELLLQVDSLTLEKSFRKNIMGKIGFGSDEDRNVFSLALVNRDCGADDARLAFFLADGSGDSLSCSNAVVSSGTMDFGSWMHVVVVFESGTLRMYKNGSLDNEQKVSVTEIQESDESIFFGKENLNLKLDDVRLGRKAITSADVLYRYNLKGGAL